MIGPITGILAARRGVVAEYYTTVLYPYVIDEQPLGLQYDLSATSFWKSPEDAAMYPLPALLGGDLIPTIVYQSYNGATEAMVLGAPALLSGDLIPTIVYQSYNNGATEAMVLGAPALLGGELNTTISYIAYNNGATEAMVLGAPALLGGTLT